MGTAIMVPGRALLLRGGQGRRVVLSILAGSATIVGLCLMSKLVFAPSVSRMSTEKAYDDLAPGDFVEVPCAKDTDPCQVGKDSKVSRKGKDFTIQANIKCSKDFGWHSQINSTITELTTISGWGLSYTQEFPVEGWVKTCWDYDYVLPFQLGASRYKAPSCPLRKNTPFPIVIMANLGDWAPANLAVRLQSVGYSATGERMFCIGGHAKTP